MRRTLFTVARTFTVAPQTQIRLASNLLGRRTRDEVVRFILRRRLISPD